MLLASKGAQEIPKWPCKACCWASKTEQENSQISQYTHALSALAGMLALKGGAPAANHLVLRTAVTAMWGERVFCRC